MSEALFARLARLRREERPAPGARPDAAGLPAWLTERFAAREALEEPEPAHGRALGPPEDLVEHGSARGSFAARTRVFAAHHAHGEWRLGEMLAGTGDELGWLARDPALASLEPGRSVYLDIETTGLAGGAGTIPFLIALGSFHAAPDGELEFHLWQAFLRDPSEEAAALCEVAERIRGASGVVSFFGKSFDRHRLEDKMRLHRIAPPFAGKPHLDLYHPLRRLYGGSLADTRLATFEAELCGVARENDLSGAFAPGAWFDFLAGRPHRLEGVFRHNALDVLSLVALGAHLACARREARPDGRALGGPGRARARALAELHARRKEHAEALEWLERALTRPGGDEGALWLRHAECLRRLGERERALEELLRLARESADALAARAWCEVARLARRLKRAELAAEAEQRGRRAAERAFTGRTLARLLARLEPSRRARRTGAGVE